MWLTFPPRYTISFVWFYTWPAASTLNVTADSGIPFVRYGEAKRRAHNHDNPHHFPRLLGGLMYIAGPTTRPFTAPTEELCLPYAINDQHDAPRSNCAKRRSWQATRRYARIIARPPAVGSQLSPLQRLLQRPCFARPRLCARPA